MVSLDEAVVARLTSHGHDFEILVDPELALKFREEKGNLQVDPDDLLAVQNVFLGPARDGDKAGNEELQKAFGSTDVIEAVKKILLKGDLQLTTDQRRRMVERKRRIIIQKIAQNAINPQTKTPHPPTRIELAMDEARVHIDPFKSADAQIPDVLKALRPLIPIRFENVTIAVHLPATEAGKAAAIVRGFGELVKEEWQRDGSWIGLIEMPAGMQTDFFTELNHRTHGNAETKIIKHGS